MPYSPTTYVNGTTPAINAANLNNLKNELVSQALAKGVSHTLQTWVNGTTPAVSDPTNLNEMERVARAVGLLLSPVINYTVTTWGAGWTPARNAANLNKLEQAAAANRANMDAGGFSADRYVYGLGVPPFSYANGGSTSTNWVYLPPQKDDTSHVIYDDTVDVMHNLIAGTNGSVGGTPQYCHTVRLSNLPGDPEDGPQGGYWHSLLQPGSSPTPWSLGQPTIGAFQGNSQWYGMAFTTNAGFTPNPVYINWNNIYSFHTSIGSQVEAGLQLGINTHAPSGAVPGTSYNYDTPMVPIPDGPHLCVDINGGNIQSPIGAADVTMTRHLGPRWFAGQRYVVVWYVVWDSFGNGTTKVWIDGVQYVNVVGGSSNFMRSGNTPDPGTYFVFENYTHAWALPAANHIYYGGMVKGSTQADVTFS